MIKQELKDMYSKRLRQDSGKIRAFSTSLKVAELTFSCCENGRSYAWNEFVDFSGNTLSEESEEVQAFKVWMKEEWNRFAMIANQKGVTAGKKKTAVI